MAPCAAILRAAIGWPLGQPAWTICAGIAQLVERLIRNEEVRGSNPRTGTIPDESTPLSSLA